MRRLLYFVLVINVVLQVQPARILTVVPIPSISHQVVFRPLTQELVKRGHDVTIITTDPIFPKGQAPENLTEIDLHDLSYTQWRKFVYNSDITSGNQDDIVNQMRTLMPVASDVFMNQLLSKEVQNLLKSKPKFDLLILEACSRQTIIYSHIFPNIPVMLFSSFGGMNSNFDVVGAISRPPLLYPSPLRQRLYNLTFSEKITELYRHYIYENVFEEQKNRDDKRFKKIFGEDTPSTNELENNVDMLMLNFHPIWDQNRPVPPNVIYIGGIHQKPSNKLPMELQSYLDSSENGVIYISYGTNVDPTLLPPERIQMLIKVFSQMPYDILWKWNNDELPGRSKNIRISKWLPQSDLLKHPNIKLFITQGGLQSTDEAIIAGVPLIGMPMLGDQWYNVEQYVYNKIGIRLDLETLTEDKFLKGLNRVLNDDSYRKNIVRLRALMRDEVVPPLERAVWWTEHLLRHGGRHLRPPTANMSWAEYLDVELLAVLASLGLGFLVCVIVLLYLVVRVLRNVLVRKKLKKN